MSKKKVYGVVRSGGGEPSVICEVEAVETDTDDTSPGIVSEKEAKEFAADMNAYFGSQGYEYTVFKIKFKETI